MSLRYCSCTGAARPLSSDTSFILTTLTQFCFGYSLCSSERGKALNTETTLSGGSLGSCVDEERSQLRELM